MSDNTFTKGPPPNPTPKEFELAVKKLLEEEAVGLTDFRAEHLERIEGADGAYTFDVTARFTVLGAEFLVLVECKRVTRVIERETVQILHQKQLSVGAQKSILVSTAPFRFGALEFARSHGIALVRMEDGQLQYEVKSYMQRPPHQPWLPEYSFVLERSVPDALYAGRRLGSHYYPTGVEPGDEFLKLFLSGYEEEQ